MSVWRAVSTVLLELDDVVLVLSVLLELVLPPLVLDVEFEVLVEFAVVPAVDAVLVVVVAP